MHTKIIEGLNFFEGGDGPDRLIYLVTTFCESGLKDKIYFQFRREESLFLSNEEVLSERIEIPNYIINHGSYKEVRKLDNARFDSFACLPVDELTFSFLPRLWRYFYSLDFFFPTSNYSWDAFLSDFGQNNMYGAFWLQNSYTETVFMKGLGGDCLILSTLDPETH